MSQRQPICPASPRCPRLTAESTSFLTVVVNLTLRCRDAGGGTTARADAVTACRTLARESIGGHVTTRFNTTVMVMLTALLLSPDQARAASSKGCEGGGFSVLGLSGD